jgi:hypothetical protein
MGRLIRRRQLRFDLGAQVSRNSGFSDREPLALPRYRQSDLFTERDKTTVDRGRHRVLRVLQGDGLRPAGSADGPARVGPDCAS